MRGGSCGVKSMDNHLHDTNNRILHYVLTFPMDEFTWTPRILDHHNTVAYEVQKCCKYTKYCIECHPFYLSCSTLNVNRPCSITNTIVNLTLFVVPVNNKLGTIDLQCCNDHHLLSDFSSKFQ